MRSAREVRKLIEPGAPAPDALRLERIADAIVSIEYYMETLQSGRTDPWYMLDNAEMCIKALAERGAVAGAERGAHGERGREDRQARSGRRRLPWSAPSARMRRPIR